jgi:sugar phosphate permease
MMALWGFLVGSGTGMIAMVLGATVAERWFVQNRGLVLGILTASSATGQLIFLPLLATLSVNFGWRAVSLTVALIAMVMAPIAALLLRNLPSDIGLPRYGETDLHRVARRNENPAHRALSALRRGLLSRDHRIRSGRLRWLAWPASCELRPETTRSPSFRPGCSVFWRPSWPPLLD